MEGLGIEFGSPSALHRPKPTDTTSLNQRHFTSQRKCPNIRTTSQYLKPWVSMYLIPNRKYTLCPQGTTLNKAQVYTTWVHGPLYPKPL